MKKITGLIMFIVMWVLTACSVYSVVRTSPNDGTLYSEKNLTFFKYQRCRWYEDMSESIVIIENNKQLEIAQEGYINERIHIKNDTDENYYINLSELPEINEMIDKYPLDDYTYVIQYIDSGSGSHEVTCKGVRIDKDNLKINFDIIIKTPKTVTQDINGHVFCAVFPKEELSGIVFENAEYPSGEATDLYYELIDGRIYKCDPW